ncbi:DoxX family protein [Tianweitania sediminis]|uniref:DoxX family protein n=1 Tax=Tianweitania sediminis TaxID=1502156 RepID=A0A8J7R2V0_9HYPH|nr:DoxX family protein [Tianweitania sediminis]
MILNYSWAVWLAWLLGAFFVVDGVLNLVGIKPVKNSFKRWNLPSWFHLFNGLVQLVTGLLVLWYPTRPLGLLLGALICLAIFAILARHRDWGHFPPSVILLIVILVDAWGLRLI